MGAAALFDALDAARVFLGAAERHRRSVVVVDHLLELGLPVADELGHVRPDLGRLPALGAAFVGIGQAPSAPGPSACSASRCSTSSSRSITSVVSMGSHYQRLWSRSI